MLNRLTQLLMVKWISVNNFTTNGLNILAFAAHLKTMMICENNKFNQKIIVVDYQL